MPQNVTQWIKFFAKLRKANVERGKGQESVYNLQAAIDHRTDLRIAGAISTAA